MKTTKKAVAVILALIMLFACSGNAFATDTAKEKWDEAWQTKENEINSAVTMFPGSDEYSRSVA